MSEALPQPEQLTLDDELYRQSEESEMHKKMVSRLESPEDLIRIRETLSGLNDEQADEQVEEYIVQKLLGDDGVASNGAELVQQYGSDIGDELKNIVLDYATMPDEEFATRIDSLKKNRESAEPIEQTNDTFAANVTRATSEDIPMSAVAMMGHESQTVAPKHDVNSEHEDSSVDTVEPYEPKHLDESKPETDNTDYAGKHLRVEESDTEEDLRITDRIRKRWTNLKNGIYTLPDAIRLAIREMKGSDGSEEQKKWIKRGMIGAVAVAGMGLMVVASRKGMDFDPGIFDGDGMDLNPLNNSDGASEAAQTAGSESTGNTTSEMVSVTVDPGEGTSHIARDHLGINFDTVEQWNQFNAETNPLFENVDGMYKDSVTGEWHISAPGKLQVPQEVLNKVTKIAERIKNS